VTGDVTGGEAAGAFGSAMSRTRRHVLLAAMVAAALALAWGYWHSQTHASLNLQVEDHGLKTETLAYGSPHNVTLTYLGADNEPLAIARSVEPLGYILAVHPSSDIGNCEQRGVSAIDPQGSPRHHADCYAKYSAWASEWAPRVRRAHAVVGACELRNLPVRVHASNDDWWLWWVPLPHIGGVPRRYFDFAVKLDSRACTAVG
jgi:hypothetical protein